jgi:hypothetical protein
MFEQVIIAGIVLISKLSEIIATAIGDKSTTEVQLLADIQGAFDEMQVNIKTMKDLLGKNDTDIDAKLDGEKEIVR